jgi:hypothetical protein
MKKTAGFLSAGFQRYNKLALENQYNFFITVAFVLR